MRLSTVRTRLLVVRTPVEKIPESPGFGYGSVRIAQIIMRGFCFLKGNGNHSPPSPRRPRHRRSWVFGAPATPELAFGKLPPSELADCTGTELGASLSCGLVRSLPKKTLVNSPSGPGRRGGRQSFGSHWKEKEKEKNYEILTLFPERSEGKSVKVELTGYRIDRPKVSLGRLELARSQFHH